ncbi:MAG TPA: YdcF family protein [Terriglobales bacterium]|nr:YdcF family protein [Terriglobales bacterium]
MRQRIVHGVTRALAGLVLIVILLGALPLEGWVYRALLVEHAPRAADAIVILAGGIAGADTATEETTMRLVHGLRLYRRGHAPVIVLSGGGVSRHGPEAAVMRRMALDLGADASTLVLETVSRRTASQGTAVAELARARGFRTILLVTSAEHSFRASRVFAKTGLEVISTPVHGSHGTRLAVTLRPYQIARRVCGLVDLAYEGAAIALYWSRGWL